MDVKIENGDIALMTNGDYKMIGDLDEAVQRVRMVMLTDRGTFVFDRTLGVDYDAFSPEEDDPAGKLDMLVKEAAADIDADVEVLSYDAQNAAAQVKVTYHGRTVVTEVDISGNI